MSSVTENVLQGPRVAGIQTGCIEAVCVHTQLQSLGHRFLSDVDLLFAATKSEADTPKEFFLECRSGVDYGYAHEKSLPTIGSLFNHAETEGLLLGSARIVFSLLLRRTPPIRAGQACLVAMKPLLGDDSRWYLPHIQGIERGDGCVTTAVRLVAGNPLNSFSRTFPILFFRSV